MDIEVSLKIRSAIKAKLVELGCHVDEELPDYIMVLIANRRTRVQMEEDLFLFLGDNTGAFTLWLHHVLKKLEHITTTTGKVGLFASGAVSTSAGAEEDNSVEVPSSPSVVDEKPSRVEKSKGTKKRSKGDEKVDKKKRKITESKSPKKPSLPSPKKIKISRNNIKESPKRVKSSSKDSRDSSKSSKPAPAAVENVHHREERISDPTPTDDAKKNEEFSAMEDETSLSTTADVPEIEPIFKVPTTATVTKKIKIPKRRSSTNEPDEEDNDDEDCLNLKAEADDLFLEPGAQQGKLKMKIVKKAVAPPTTAASVEIEAEAKELELLRQKVIESTKKKRSIMSRLGEPVTVVKSASIEAPVVSKTVKSPTRSRKSETPPPPSRSSSKSDDSSSPVKESKESAFSRIDRKKISVKNIESLNRIIKSNSEVKRDSKNDTTRPRPRSPKPKREEVPRRKLSTSSRDRSPRRSRDRDETDRERQRSTHDRKRKADRELYTQPKQLKSSIGSVINRTRQRYEKEEEYDPSCPEVNNKLQSIVKIPERNSRKPKVVEPTNKKLLFRAIADAEKSLLQTRQVKSQFEEKESTIESELKNKRTHNSKTTKKSIHDRLGYIEKKHEKTVPEPMAKNEEDEEGVIVEEWEYEDDADVEGEIDDDLEMCTFNSYEDDETIIINIPNESNVGRNVMLEMKDMMDSNSKTVQRQKSDVYTGPISQPKKISIQVHTDDDDDDDDSSTTDDDDNNHSDQERSASANENVYRSEDSVPSNADMDTSSRDFDIGLNESNIKLPSPDDQSERENSDTRLIDRNDLILNTKKVVARSDSRIQITLNNDCASMSPTSTMGSLNPNPVKIFQQPTFPLQPQQSQMPIQQHTQICKFWPNCTFSDKCMFSHPPCKFNTKCTKPNCPYKHIGFIKNTIPTTRQPHPKSLNSGRPHPGNLQGNTGAPAGGITTGNNAVKTCKYFPKCHTMSCPYFHPTPCRYGTGCTDLMCKNYHPGVTVAKKKFTTTTKTNTDLFKWKAPTLATSSSSNASTNSSADVGKTT